MARTEGDAHANQSAEQRPIAPGTVVVSASKFALCTRSEVLRPILAACKNQAKLEVLYESQEHLEAGKLVVQLLHDLAMPSHLKRLDWDATPPAPSLVVQMCQWADYWDAAEVVELCLDRLCRCELDALSASDINDILELPSAVIATPQFSSVKEKCAAWLLRSFSDVPKIIADDGLRASFCSEFSFAAVALWAAQDGLTVRSENKVAVTLSFWYDGVRDSVSDKEAAQLSGLVRVCQMQKSFHHFVLPKLAWFRPPMLFSAFNFIYDDGGCEAVSGHYVDKLPPAWMAPARCGRPVSGSAQLTFAFPKVGLESMALLAAAGILFPLDSDPQPFCGYFFRLVLNLYPSGSLGAYLLSSHCLIPHPPALTIRFSLEHTNSDGSVAHLVAPSTTHIEEGTGKGCNVFPGRSFRCLEDFTPLLADGENLVLKFELSNIK